MEKQITPLAGELLTAFEMEQEKYKNMLVDKVILDKIDEIRRKA